MYGMQLERGLELIQNGQIGLDGNDLDDDSTTTKKRKVNRYPGYTDAEWGTRTRAWAMTALRLEAEKKWDGVLHAAVEKLDLSGADDGDVEDGAIGGASDPCAMIELW